MTLGFSHYAQEAPARLALAAPDGRHWSRGELQAKCNRIAHGLRQLGLQPGDRIAAMLPNCAEFLALKLATAQIGCELLLINLEHEASQVAAALKETGVWTFIAHENVAYIAQHATVDAGFPMSAAYALGTIPDFRSFQLLVDRQVESPPKNCAREAPSELLALLDIQPEADNTHYCGLPLYQREVMDWASQSLNYGHAVVLAEQWDPLHMLQAIDQYRVTTCVMVPAQFERLLKLPQAARERFDVSSTRHVVNITAPCPQKIKQEMAAWWGESIYEHFTEAYTGNQFDCWGYRDKTDRSHVEGHQLVQEINRRNELGELVDAQRNETKSH
ncbi:MAG: AMP-binding protein [Halioglobus sp.]